VYSITVAVFDHTHVEFLHCW